MKTYSLKQIAEHLNAQLIGNEETIIIHAGTIQDGQNGEIGFLNESTYKKYLNDCQLSALICNEKLETSINQLIVSDVKSAWRKVLTLFQADLPPAQISPKALLGENIQLGAGVSIGMGAIIEDGVKIGAGTRIGAGTIIERGVVIGENGQIDAGVKILEKTRIGDRVRILSGAVIGSRGFGLNFEGGKWLEIPQLGGVFIGDDVEIGACTTIDCGAVRDTIIEDGVKLDNQIQVGHNVRIGAHTIMAGCSVIAGSTTFGKYCVVGGASVFAGHITICDGAQFTGHTSVSKSVTEKGLYSSAFPAVSDREWKRFVAKLRMFSKD